MQDRLTQEINQYWSNRASSYSEVNQDELKGIQHRAWQKLISDTIAQNHHNKNSNALSILDIGAGPGFFSIILAD